MQLDNYLVFTVLLSIRNIWKILFDVSITVYRETICFIRDTVYDRLHYIIHYKIIIIFSYDYLSLYDVYSIYYTRALQNVYKMRTINMRYIIIYCIRFVLSAISACVEGGGGLLLYYMKMRDGRGGWRKSFGIRFFYGVIYN